MDFLLQIRRPDLTGFGISLAVAVLTILLCYLLGGLDSGAMTQFSAPVAGGLIVIAFLWRQSGFYGMYLGALATLGLVLGTLLLVLIPFFLARIVVLVVMSPWAWEPFLRKKGRGLDTMMIISWVATGAHALMVVALPATRYWDADQASIRILAIFMPIALWIWFAASKNLTTGRVWPVKKRSPRG